MQVAFGHNCGSYTVALSPKPLFLELSSTGVKGPNGLAYTDSMKLLQTTLADIGEYNIEMTIS